MAVIKCTVCGGELEVNTDLTLGKCKYCDSIILIPKALERKGNLYNRAVFLRQNCEFDKAAEAYEDILKEDNTDVDAHWGLVLSKYGIEYVDDPRTGKKVPTCHRTQATSIFSDADYRFAIENADFEASRVIQNEAQQINDIQSRILTIASKEPPYDVFICYKESDDLDRRTEDSVIAQDLYYELTKKGYKVFFARKTLQKKLGSEYEPIIYAALSSAQVMIVLGTKPENFTSVWVKNEWSRFLKMRSDSKRTIIPAYKGMSPYELPAELASLQSLDMSRIGFLQDLTDGIDKLLIKPRNTEEVQAQGANESNKTILSADRLIQNGSTFLSLRKYQEAETAFGHATEMYPEDYRGWWGLIQCRTICFTKTTGFSERDLSLLRDYFAFIKQLAPENEYYSLHKQIMEYCFLVAQSKVPEERNMAKKEIQEKQQQLTDIEDRIKNITESINNYYPEQQKELHEKIIFNKYELEWFEAALKRAERLSVAGKVLIITGVVLFIFLVRISSINGFLPFVGVGVGFIGFLLAGKGKKVSAYKNLEQCKADIANFEAQEKEIISRCEEEKKRLRNIESSSQAEIPKINETVGRLEKVLALGADELAQTLLPRVLLYFGIDNEEVI